MYFSQLLRFLLLLPVFSNVIGCATATRGSNTDFVIHTLPAGATVTTDKLMSTSAKRATMISDKKPASTYYGCSPTPCSIKLPRRSDFNVMVTLSGYQPFTYVITKERNKEAAKRNNQNTNIAMATTATTISATTIAAGSGASILSIGGVVSTGMSATLIALPAIGAASGIDLASGSLIDLYPNPLAVQLAPEETPEQSEELVSMFLKMRQHRTKASRN